MKPKSHHPWTAEDILALGRSYQGAAVLAAAADLDLFTALSTAPLLGCGTCTDSAVRSARLDHSPGCPRRAAAARKVRRQLRPRRPGLRPFLTPDGAQSILAMAQHQGHCLRNWAQLGRVVKTGRPAECMPGVRGESGRSGGLHWRDAQRLRPQRRPGHPGRATVAIPAPVGHWRGFGHLDHRLSARLSLGPGHALRPAACPPDGAAAAGLLPGWTSASNLSPATS